MFFIDLGDREPDGNAPLGKFGSSPVGASGGKNPERKGVQRAAPSPF